MNEVTRNLFTIIEEAYRKGYRDGYNHSQMAYGDIELTDEEWEESIMQEIVEEGIKRTRKKFESYLK